MRKFWKLDDAWKGFIRDTWLIILIMLVTYIVFCVVLYMWLDDDLSLGQALLWGGPPFVFFNIGLLGITHYYRVHFGMTDEKISEYLARMKKRCEEREKEVHEKPESVQAPDRDGENDDKD